MPKEAWQWCPYCGTTQFSRRNACMRIGKEAECPIVIENVRGAQPWVGKSRWNYGSFHLFGDVPALMPMARKHVKVSGLNWSNYGKPGYKAEAFNTTAEARLRGDGIKNARNWWSDGAGSLSATTSSHSKARKAASAAIAKIPFGLAQYIARCFKPVRAAA